MSRKVPTTIVTVVPASTSLPPSGVCAITLPSSRGRSTDDVSTATFRPWPRRTLSAAPWSSPSTFSTVTFALPLDTITTTLEPRAASVPAPGSVPVTVPAAAVSSGSSRRSTVKPAPSSAAFAWSKL